jgi:quinol monooxygenase YgiN
MNQHAGIVRFTAQPGKGAQVAQLVAAALPEALTETGMPVWTVIHSHQEPEVVYIIDIFATPEDRAAHLSLQTAARIVPSISPFLAEAPSIHAGDLLASKGLVVS